MRKLLCKLSLAFHKFEAVEHFDQFNRKLRCSICDKYFALNTRRGAIVPWNDEIERITCEQYGLEKTNGYRSEEARQRQK